MAAAGEQVCFNIKAADWRCHDGQVGRLHLMGEKRVGRGCEMVGERVDIYVSGDGYLMPGGIRNGRGCEMAGGWIAICGQIPEARWG